MPDRSSWVQVYKSPDLVVKQHRDTGHVGVAVLGKELIILVFQPPKVVVEGRDEEEA